MLLIALIPAVYKSEPEEALSNAAAVVQRTRNKPPASLDVAVGLFLYGLMMWKLLSLMSVFFGSLQTYQNDLLPAGRNDNRVVGSAVDV